MLLHSLYNYFKLTVKHSIHYTAAEYLGCFYFFSFAHFHEVTNVRYFTQYLAKCIHLVGAFFLSHLSPSYIIFVSGLFLRINVP